MIDNIGNIDKINNTQTSAVQSLTANSVKHPAEEKAKPQKDENRDEYVSSETKEPIGLYRVSQNDEGSRQISYDDPNKAPEKIGSSDDDKCEETITANTNRVDKEIKELRERSRLLAEKLRAADPQSADAVRRELNEVYRELAQKDNDQYRRQNTMFS